MKCRRTKLFKSFLVLSLLCVFLSGFAEEVDAAKRKRSSSNTESTQQKKKIESPPPIADDTPIVPKDSTGDSTEADKKSSGKRGGAGKTRQ